MPVAFVGAGTAKLRACLDHPAEQSFVGGRSTRQGRSGNGTGVGTIEIEPDTARKIGRGFLAEASIGIGDAGSGAIEANLDALIQCIAGALAHLRTGGHRSSMLVVHDGRS